MSGSSLRRFFSAARAVAAAVALLASVGAAPAFGQGWFPQTPPAVVDLYDVELSGPSNGWLVGAGGAIARTTNGGAAWTPQSSGVGYDLRAVSFATPTAGVIAGSGLTLLYTTTGGSTWVIAQTDYMGTFHGAHMPDEQTAYSAGVNTIFQPLVGMSTNGGQTWTFRSFYIESNEGTLRAIHFTDPQTGCTVGNLWDGRGAIVRTIDGGANWQTMQITPAALYAVHFPTAQIGYAAGAGGRVYATTDGGSTWTLRPTGSGQTLRGIHFSDANTGTAVGESGTILRTTDGGVSWQSQASGTTRDLYGVCFADLLIGNAAGRSGTVLRTTTGGQDPTEIAGEPIEHAPAGFRIVSVRPNPFEGNVEIRFAAQGASTAILEIFDVTGRRIRAISAEIGSTGLHAIVWDGTDEGGRRIGRGAYFARLRDPSAQVGCGSIACDARVLLRLGRR